MTFYFMDYSVEEIIEGGDIVGYVIKDVFANRAAFIMDKEKVAMARGAVKARDNKVIDFLWRTNVPIGNSY